MSFFNKIKKAPFPPEIYPLALAVGTAVGLSVYFSTQTLTHKESHDINTKIGHTTFENQKVNRRDEDYQMKKQENNS
eukprot:CAMPEP_0201547600 /NCGR_PEP_ID=MMETSP0173_2-20130828/4073_1 /ASSEMBLY_ACC=CAM_ASM_000268 /TAXON_ID=218659 /ORGANISM="Vexillifera sp., Strain DIVA3 564/2" /LENGTH=76 /DNA_ID=CAMNT_0047956701 /DNA_START=42 /DNA_END=272 /DNA_ORIENTATION=-